MTYTLMNKNIPLLDAEIENGTIISADEIHNAKYLPVGINADNKSFMSPLIKWWSNRCISTNRHGVDESMELLNLASSYTTDLTFLT